MYTQIVKEFVDDYYYDTFVNNEIDRKESEGNWSMNIVKEHPFGGIRLSDFYTAFGIVLCR